MYGITVSGVFFMYVFFGISNDRQLQCFCVWCKRQKKKQKKSKRKTKKKTNKKKNNRMPSAKLFALDASAKSKYFSNLDIKDLNDNKKFIVT